jgi:hypothetical protein
MSGNPLIIGIFNSREYAIREFKCQTITPIDHHFKSGTRQKNLKPKLTNIKKQLTPKTPETPCSKPFWAKIKPSIDKILFINRW